MSNKELGMSDVYKSISTLGIQRKRRAISDIRASKILAYINVRGFCETRNSANLTMLYLFFLLVLGITFKLFLNHGDYIFDSGNNGKNFAVMLFGETVTDCFIDKPY